MITTTQYINTNVSPYLDSEVGRDRRARRHFSGGPGGPALPSDYWHEDSARTDSAARGFTLAEVMMATALGVFVIAGVMSSFLFIGRTGFGAESYNDMENTTHRALELFAEDARAASNIQWNSSQSITFTLPTATNATTTVTYAYDSNATSPTYQCFYRLNGAATATLPRQVLVHSVAADFAFARYKLDSSGNASAAGSDLETKQIQLMLHAQRTGNTVVTASNAAVSACYILRNKRVSN